MPYSFGDIVLVRFPFTNQKAFKQRPVVIISNQAYNTTEPDIVIMAITSQMCSQAALGEVWIANWQAANLIKPSAIKPVFATVEQNLILKCLGVLEKSDLSALSPAIASVLG